MIVTRARKKLLGANTLAYFAKASEKRYELYITVTLKLYESLSKLFY
jgi:hypothetical protein